MPAGRSLTLLTLFCCSATVLTSTSLPAFSMSESRVSAADRVVSLNLEQLQEEMDKAVEDAEFSGVVAVAVGQEVVFRSSYGFRDEVSELPNLAETRFATGSISKMITSTAIAVIWDQGEIDLDARIDVYLPDLVNGKSEEFKSITIRQLLSHTSGLGDYHTSEYWNAANRIYTLQGALPFAISDEPAFVSGTSYRYSNIGYLYLGLIIEAITKTDYHTAIQHLIFDPLEMTKSGYWSQESLQPNRARLYTKLSAESGGFVDELMEASPWLAGRGGPAGGLVSTVDDLLAFSKVYSNGNLISPAARELFHSPKIQRRTRSNEIMEGSYYGLGVTVVNPDDQNMSIGHTGGDPGTSAHLYYYPNYDLTYVVLSNRDTFSGASQYISFDEIILESQVQR